jgi:perosamine synthetase
MPKQAATVALRQHKIPFFVPTIGKEEVESVVETLRSGWIATGPKVKQFEAEFARRIGARHAVAVASGTAALHAALEAVGVSPGDEVLVPTLTFAATAAAAIHLGAKPVLVDCRGDTLNIDLDRIEEKITPRTKAIMPVHYAGQPCDMDRVLEVAQAHNLKVVEDAAHALPARYGDRRIGTIGDVTCFSFYANKTITTGEGGMITTDDDRLAERMRIMTFHGISKDAWKRFSAEGSWYYEILAPGYKYNLTDIAASLGIHQLARCDEFWQARRRCAEQYNAGLASVPEIVIPYLADNVQHAWHLYVIQLQVDRLQISRNEFIHELNKAGIGVNVHYMPLHMHPYYRDTFGYHPEDFPTAKSAYDRMISLPVYPRLSDADVQYVVNTIKSVVARNRKGGSALLELSSSGMRREAKALVAKRDPAIVSQTAKRVFDFTVALLSLLTLSPLLLLVAVLIKITSRGPVFFLQERVGRDFSPFRIVKFRTMVPEAPGSGRELTVGRDPRITPIGHFLRKTKLDEIPQLLNVLVGQMSLVGPRPETPRYVQMFRKDYHELLTVRPGITDLASIKYRHESDILGHSPDPESTYVSQILPDKIALGRHYIHNCSLWFDLRLLLKTVFRVADCLGSACRSTE